MGFLPLGDDNRYRRATPVIVGLLVLMNLAGWALQLLLGEVMTMGFATVPFEVVNNIDLTGDAPLALQSVVIDGKRHFIHQHPGPEPIQLTLLSSMFMHGSWVHLLGNMLYLWIFGDQIEDLLGRVRFVVFYLACGLIAAMAQVLGDPGSILPCVGASGAIAGVLGAYLMKFPTNAVQVLVGIWPVVMPAVLVLGGWIALQILEQQRSLAGQGAGGIAYLAHIGGFLAGTVLVFVFSGRRRTSFSDR
jgi:membrane associated rhomboid family serine protease